MGESEGEGERRRLRPEGNYSLDFLVIFSVLLSLFLFEEGKRRRGRKRREMRNNFTILFFPSLF